MFEAGKTRKQLMISMKKSARFGRKELAQQLRSLVASSDERPLDLYEIRERKLTSTPFYPQKSLSPQANSLS